MLCDHDVTGHTMTSLAKQVKHMPPFEALGTEERAAWEDRCGKIALPCVTFIAGHLPAGLSSKQIATWQP